MTSSRPPCNAPASAPLRSAAPAAPTPVPGIGTVVYSAHSLRAGFGTYAHLRGAYDRAIAHQTRHRSLATIGTYIRIDNAWQDNAATELGL
jgi:integrase